MLSAQRTNSARSARRTPHFEKLIGGMLQPINLLFAMTAWIYNNNNKKIRKCFPLRLSCSCVVFLLTLYSMFFCVAVFVLVLRTVLCSIHHLDTEVQHQCKQRCPLQVIVNFCKQFVYLYSAKQLWRRNGLRCFDHVVNGLKKEGSEMWNGVGFKKGFICEWPMISDRCQKWY